MKKWAEIAVHLWTSSIYESMILAHIFAKHCFSSVAGSYVTHETNYFVYFYIDSKAVLLFKSGWLAQLLWSPLHACILLLFCMSPFSLSRLQPKLEAGEAIILWACMLMYQRQIFPPYSSSVRSDRICFASDISRCCEDVVLLQYDCLKYWTHPLWSFRDCFGSSCPMFVFSTVDFSG